MNAERRPGEGAASESAGWPASSVRRRRDAASRSEPIPHNGLRDPWRFEPLSTTRNLEASRAAWAHLKFCGLVDSEGFVDGVLRDLGQAS